MRSAGDLYLRAAKPDDLDAIAALFSASLASMDFVPRLYTEPEEHQFIGNVVLPQCSVTVAVSRDAVVSFVARDDAEIRLLHTRPDHVGRGAGSMLLRREQEIAQSEDRGLFLWCFQDNRRARAFYERHGFHADAFSDGSRNEEKLPDMRYVWPGSFSVPRR